MLGLVLFLCSQRKLVNADQRIISLSLRTMRIECKIFLCNKQWTFIFPFLFPSTYSVLCPMAENSARTNLQNINNVDVHWYGLS